MKRKYTIEQVKEAVKNSLSLANVLRLLNFRPVGGNYKTFKTIITAVLKSYLNSLTLPV